jgi:hypothetical protein
MLAARMQGINGTAEIIQTTSSDVDLEKIIGRNAFSLQKILEIEPDFLKVPLIGTLYLLPIACSLPEIGADGPLTALAQPLQALVNLWQMFARMLHCHAVNCVCEKCSGGILHAMLWHRNPLGLLLLNYAYTHV